MLNNMKAVCLFLIVTLAAALGLAGCSSPAGAQGVIQVGDTPEQVRSALGKPDGKQGGPDIGVDRAVWIYVNQRPGPPQATGWREVLVPGVRDQHDRVVQEPVTREIYRTPVTGDVRVVFTDGKVSSIEHLRR